MQKVVPSGIKVPRHALSGFTLIELLTVIAIIAILATLILGAASGLETQAERKRAMSEITGLSIALENYKKDNGIYPVSSTLVGPPSQTYYPDPSSTGGPYQVSSQTLYQALSGQAYFNSPTAPTGTVYFPFNKKQIGSPTGPTSYVQDPWGYSYGYSTGNPSTPPQASDPAPYHGAGFYDLWSTGGTTTTGTTANTTGSNPAWVVNWQ